MKPSMIRSVVALALVVTACDDGSSNDGENLDAATLADASTGGEDAAMNGDATVMTDDDAGVDSDAGTDANVGPGCSNTGEPGKTIEVCPIEGGVRHVRIVGAAAPRSHASYQFFLGLDAAVGAQDALQAGQFKVQFYGGGMPQPSPGVDAYLGATSAPLDGLDASFINTPSTVCFDIHDGSETTPASFVLWVDGQKGADCENLATLNMNSAVAFERSWTGAVDKSKKSFFYQASSATTTPTITLFSAPALSAASIDGWVGPDCTSTVNRAEAGPTTLELCQLDEPVRHIKLEGVQLTADHAAAQILLGADDAFPDSQAELTAGQFRFATYNPPGPTASVYGSFGTTNWNVSGVNLSGLSASPQTLCFDLHDGSDTAAPYYVVWMTGARGADCGNIRTLTLDTAIHIETEWSGAAFKNKKNYYYQTALVTVEPTITLSSSPVLSAEQIEATRCVTADFEPTNLYQPFCSPAAGPARHFRVENAGMSAENKYFYLVVGDATSDHEQSVAGPSGSAMAGDRVFVLTAGKSQSSATDTYTYFRFNGGDSGNVTSDTSGWYATGTPEGQLWYTEGDFDGPSTVCFDLKPEGEDTRFILWAQGINEVDCFDRESLAIEDAIYDSIVDDADSFWKGSTPSDSGNNFFKASGSADFATVQRITTFSTPAVP